MLGTSVKLKNNPLTPFFKGEPYENNTISQNFKFLYRTIVIKIIRLTLRLNLVGKIVEKIVLLF